MRIINREEFMRLLPNILYSEYEPCNFGPLLIKGKTIQDHNGRNIDWNYQQIADAVDCNDSGEFVDILENAQTTGCDFSIDLRCEGRDGLFDEDQLYAVWEKKDVVQLIERLKECL